MRKAQVSLEYLLIVGLAFAVLIPTSYFFYTYSQSSNEATIRSQINKVGNNFLTTAESSYGLAEGSILTAEATYPRNVKDIYILNKNELIIKYDTGSGVSEAVFFSSIDLAGNYTYTPGNDCELSTRSICTNITLLNLPCANSAFTANCPTQGNHNVKFESRGSYVLIYNSN